MDRYQCTSYSTEAIVDTDLRGIASIGDNSTAAAKAVSSFVSNGLRFAAATCGRSFIDSTFFPEFDSFGSCFFQQAGRMVEYLLSQQQDNGELIGTNASFGEQQRSPRVRINMLD